MIQSIQQTIMSEGRAGEPLWFHPRACLFPGKDKADRVFMTMQQISGSDYFHPVHWATSSVAGEEWSIPEPVPGFDRTNVEDGMQEGVCDVVPEYHEKTGTVLAIGHNVFYRDGSLILPQPRRVTVYSVWNVATGHWSEKKRIAWPGPGGDQIYTAACAQRYTYPDGDILIPFSIGEPNRSDRRVISAQASFDGSELTIRETGLPLELPVERGLLEPSITRFRDVFYMTIRAEDNRGYVVRSEDGLSWSALAPWCWDDGEVLTMSTTQQRWITHSDGLFLVYTRKDRLNINVMRWRAPLYIAQVDPETLRLKRESERVVVPLSGDGIQNPDHVARLGNFHTVNVTPDESWVTVGESLPHDGWKGNTIIGRVHWSRKNALV